MSLPPNAVVAGAKGKSAPGRIRTCDLWLRRPTLYPAELRAHTQCEGGDLAIGTRFYQYRVHRPRARPCGSERQRRGGARPSTRSVLIEVEQRGERAGEFEEGRSSSA